MNNSKLCISSTRTYIQKKTMSFVHVNTMSSCFCAMQMLNPQELQKYNGMEMFVIGKSRARLRWRIDAHMFVDGTTTVRKIIFLPKFRNILGQRFCYWWWHRYRQKMLHDRFKAFWKK